jgi:hypothetical protein
MVVSRCKPTSPSSSETTPIQFNARFSREALSPCKQPLITGSINYSTRGSALCPAPARRAAERAAVASLPLEQDDWDDAAAGSPLVGLIAVVVVVDTLPKLRTFSTLDHAGVDLNARPRQADVAIDLVAETFARAFENQAQFSGSDESGALAWVASTGARLLRSVLRTRRSRGSDDSTRRAVGPDGSIPALTDEPAAQA